MECEGDLRVSSASEPIGDLSWLSGGFSCLSDLSCFSFSSCCSSSSRIEYSELALSKELPACVFSSCELCVETKEGRNKERESFISLQILDQKAD